MSNLLLTIIFTLGILAFFLLASIPEIRKMKRGIVVPIEEEEEEEITPPKPKRTYKKRTKTVTKKTKNPTKKEKEIEDFMNQLDIDRDSWLDVDTTTIKKPEVKKANTVTKKPTKKTAPVKKEPKKAPVKKAVKKEPAKVEKKVTKKEPTKKAPVKTVKKEPAKVDKKVKEKTSFYDTTPKPKPKKNITFKIKNNVQLTNSEISKINKIIDSSNHAGFILQMIGSRTMLNWPVSNTNELNRVKSEIEKHKSDSGKYDTYLLWNATVEKFKLSDLVNYKPVN